MSFTLKELLQVEDSDILDFRCAETGILLWPLLRNQFFRILISRLYYNQQPLVKYSSAGNYVRLLKIIPKIFWHNLRFKQKKVDVMLFTTGAGHFLKEGYWFNRIADYFATAHQASINIEGVADQFLPEPRHQKNTAYWLFWQLIISVYGRLFVKETHLKMASNIINYANERSEKTLGIRLDDHEIRSLLKITSPKIARLKVAIRIYRYFLKKISPKLLIVEQGCYGDSGVLNLVAHEMRIRVAEMQHGMVSAGHDAYCFSEDVLISDEYKRYLPDDFLGYGDWWNTQINVPIKKWAIGNPHYSIQKKGFTEKNRQSKQDILLLSDGIEFEQYLDLAKKLRSLSDLNKYRIVLRPHPLERELLMKKYPSGMIDDVKLDFGRNVYESFALAISVLGEVSTALFEAVGLVEKIFIWKTPKAEFSYPEHPFMEFSETDEFMQKFLHTQISLPDSIIESIWSDNWQQNYCNYLNKVL
jgi:hypothetical protein